VAAPAIEEMKMNAATLFQPALSEPSPRRLRSAGAVIAGIATVAVLSSVGDAICHATGIYPTEGAAAMSGGLYLLATAYRCAFQVLGGYVTARLAPHRPAKHVAVLACIGFVLASLGAAAAWKAGPSLGPLWYPLGLVALSVPTVLAGGFIRAFKK
jgi:hypothetical protein